jgi:outer membrane protein OmpA-like peptidoglycan-associated protein
MKIMPKLIALIAAVLALAACAVTPQHYLVFFPKDVTNLTPEGQAVVIEIARRSATLHPSRIIVRGEADRATDQDTALADIRAAHVVAALSDAGLDMARIERRPPGVAADATAVRRVEVTLAP